MDFDLLKLYKEYEDLQSKLGPLRTEYNFLIDDIEKKKKEHELVGKSISSLKESVGKEREKLDLDKNQLYDSIENERKNLDIYISKRKQELQELEDKSNKTLLENNMNIQDINKELHESVQMLEDIHKKRDIAIEEHRQYVLAMDTITNDNKKSEADLKLERQKHEEIIKEYKKILEEYKISDEKHQKTIKNISIEQEKLSKARLELEQKSLELHEKEKLIQVKLEEQNNAILNANKAKSVAEDKLQELKDKELQITKTITDFQEEKYRFLVLMKAQGIKKSDLKDLEDKFTMNV